MRSNTGILCALQSHMSLLRGISTPLTVSRSCSLVEYNGQRWALARQGRTSSISYENAWNLIRAFKPDSIVTFGPAAIVGEERNHKCWFQAQHCAHAVLRSGDTFLKIVDDVTCPHESDADSYTCKPAHILVSVDDFIADIRLTQLLARHYDHKTTLLDMGGYGVSRACDEAGVPWKHFRWATDYAGDTAVNQFSRNVRELGKRGSEVIHLLEEVRHEYSAVH